MVYSQVTYPLSWRHTHSPDGIPTLLTSYPRSWRHTHSPDVIPTLLTSYQLSWRRAPGRLSTTRHRQRWWRVWRPLANNFNNTLSLNCIPHTFTLKTPRIVVSYSRKWSESDTKNKWRHEEQVTSRRTSDVTRIKWHIYRYIHKITSIWWK